jgi:hypothetical protein
MAVQKIAHGKKAWFASLAFFMGVTLLALFAHLTAKGGLKDQGVVNANAEGLRQILTASVVLAFYATAIEIEYRNPIVKDSSASITATISQRVIYRRDPSYGASDTNAPEPQVIERLKWPLTLSLKSAAFKFSPNESTKKIAAGAHLPATVTWAPVANSSGDWTLIFNAQNINGKGDEGDTLAGDWGINLTTNGKTSRIGASDDVVLPLSVYPLEGISNPAYRWLALIGALVSFVIGSELLVGLFSRFWSWLRPIADNT